MIESNVATVLPHRVREDLIAASRLEPEVEKGCSELRVRTIDSITRRAKGLYPQLFKRGYQ
jgi:hypothetical protein